MPGKRVETKTNFLPIFAGMGLPTPEPEFIFRGIGGNRKWRFDYAWGSPHFVFLEYEGGTFSHGGHVRGVGYADNCAKYSEAAIMGWLGIRVECTMVKSGRAWSLLEAAFKARKNQDGKYLPA